MGEVVGHECTCAEDRNGGDPYDHAASCPWANAAIAREPEGEAESEAYYRGVADALDRIREYEFPHTDCVDFVAEKLAPPTGGE
jgi:hypothetical protein